MNKEYLKEFLGLLAVVALFFLTFLLAWMAVAV